MILYAISAVSSPGPPEVIEYTISKVVSLHKVNGIVKVNTFFSINGNVILKKHWIPFAPSTFAASSIPNGTVLKNPTNIQTAYGTLNDRYTIISPILVFTKPSFAMTIEYGIASKIGGNIYVATKTFDIIDPSFGKNLTIPYAAIDEMTIAIPVVIIAIIKLFPMFLANPKS